jgi:branched-chain amino acid transport system permease protein
MIVFGPLLILLIMYFPQGLIGYYRQRQARRAAASVQDRRLQRSVLTSRQEVRTNA